MENGHINNERNWIITTAVENIHNPSVQNTPLLTARTLSILSLKKNQKKKKKKEMERKKKNPFGSHKRNAICCNPIRRGFNCDYSKIVTEIVAFSDKKSFCYIAYIYSIKMVRSIYKNELESIKYSYYLVIIREIEELP